MKRKGFTLVELLAVIVILSVIALIATPMILNIIEETKKRSLENSVKGLLEASNYFAIENNGVYEFIFDETHKGTTKQGERLDYKGELDAKGKLYIDEEGDISLCVYNDKYYAYKNYNSGVIIGEKSKDNCNIDYDGLTNKYVAYLESEGMSSNVYTKEEVNELVSNLTTEISSLKNKIEELESNNYATKEELTNTSDNLTNTINENKANIDSVKNGLNEYALKSELSNTNNNLITTNSNLDALTSIVNNNKSNINNLSTSINSIKAQIGTNFYSFSYDTGVYGSEITNDMIINALKMVPAYSTFFVIYFKCLEGQNASLIGYNLGMEYGTGLYFNYYTSSLVYKWKSELYNITLTEVK